MCERFSDLVSAMRTAVSSLDVSRLAGSDAAELVELTSEGERLLAAARTLGAGRVAESGAWKTGSSRTPAHWIASRTQSTVGAAIATLETARNLEQLPATKVAFISGQLSEVQTLEIASAASADANAESRLLEAAQRETVAELKQQCRQIRMAAAPDENSVERIRLGRYLRHWIDRDGAQRLDGRLPPDDATARFLAAVEARAARLQEEARRSGQGERADAYAADALVALAGTEAGPQAVVHVHVDAPAFERGRLRSGESCRVDGMGPVPVTVARRLASDGIVKLIERDGVDVRRVVHAGRTVSAHLRSALEARDQICVVPKCDRRTGLEIDHIIPFAEGGPTRLDNLARLCRWHHAQKTHHGWMLGGEPGAWTWTRGRRAPP